MVIISNRFQYSKKAQQKKNMPIVQHKYKPPLVQIHEIIFTVTT